MSARIGGTFRRPHVFCVASYEQGGKSRSGGAEKKIPIVKLLLVLRKYPKKGR